jgi:ComF family protein
VEFLREIKDGFDGILEFIYPSVCLVCKSYIGNAGLICDRCWIKVDYLDLPVCGNCGQQINSDLKCTACSGEESFPVVALGQYIDPLKEIIHQFKYSHFRNLGYILGEKLIDKHATIITKAKPDIIISVPLHSYRLRSRGFNQAADLADKISDCLDIQVDHHSLVKLKRTRDQARLDSRSRKVNLRGSFGVINNELTDRRVLIMDDVMTTGSTIREVKMTLESAGARPVMAVVAAIAG